MSFLIGKSCCEIKSFSPKVSSGSYVIDPDGEGGCESIILFCNMTDKNGAGVTVIGHDSEKKTAFGGFAASGSYIKDFQYSGVNSSMTYWGGGGPADLFKCACGVAKQCANPSDGCICDKNDVPWREDKGIFREKSHLSVIGLRFGDTGGPYVYGHHTLGKLKCYGTI